MLYVPNPVFRMLSIPKTLSPNPPFRISLFRMVYVPNDNVTKARCSECSSSERSMFRIFRYSCYFHQTSKLAQYSVRLVEAGSCSRPTSMNSDLSIKPRVSSNMLVTSQSSAVALRPIQLVMTTM